jgi:peptidoglycan/LPS O-acetylase OafA/YrhL
MNIEQPVKRDERTVAVENAAFKWAYHFLFFGLLLDCFYRHKVRNENIWDLLALAGVSVAVITVYLVRHKAAVLLVPWRKFLFPLVVCIVVVLVFLILGFVTILLYSHYQ